MNPSADPSIVTREFYLTAGFGELDPKHVQTTVIQSLLDAAIEAAVTRGWESFTVSIGREVLTSSKTRVIIQITQARKLRDTNESLLSTK